MQVFSNGTTVSLANNITKELKTQVQNTLLCPERQQTKGIMVPLVNLLTFAAISVQGPEPFVLWSPSTGLHKDEYTIFKVLILFLLFANLAI